MRKTVRGRSYAARVLFGDDLWEELAACGDGDELCRLLLRWRWSVGSSTRPREAVELLRRVHGTSELGDVLVALLLCTWPRWRRVTSRLITAIEEGGLLSEEELDDLAESLLAHELVICYPVGWVSPDWLKLEGGITLPEDTLGDHEVSVRPPLRRWAAARALRASPGRLDELVEAAEGFDPHGRDAALHGLLDAAGVLAEGELRELVKRALRSGQAPVRRAALSRIAQLDGPEAAVRTARSDPNATVRAWRPSSLPLQLVRDHEEAA